MSAERPGSPENKTAVSRRRFLAGSAGIAAIGGGISGCAHGPKMPGMTPKAEANYQDHPNGLAHCSICKHFASPNVCEVVAGPVSPDGWCRFYALF